MDYPTPLVSCLPREMTDPERASYMRLMDLAGSLSSSMRIRSRQAFCYPAADSAAPRARDGHDGICAAAVLLVTLASSICVRMYPWGQDTTSAQLERAGVVKVVRFSAS